VDEDPEEQYRLQQYEIVWILASQHRLPDHPDGFGLESLTFSVLATRTTGASRPCGFVDRSSAPAAGGVTWSR
jgi:hypothetical protein